MIIIKINYASTLPNVNITYDNSVIYAKVVYGNGGGGAATWGLINGTLSNQTDLQNALDAKVPYSGATDDVDLGEYGISTGFLQFDTTPTNTPATQGALYWDDSRETVSMIMDGTIQHIGQDSFFYVKNSTGSTIAKGTGVRFAGTDGASGHIRIDKFLANGTYPSTYFMGVTAESIGNGEFGQVMHFGELEGINTNAFSAGSLLYASTSVAGGFQTTVPSAPNNIVLVAATLNQKNNGAIVVRPTPGSNINTDEGVLISNPTNGQVLKYNSTSGLWENATDTVGTGTVTSVAVSGGTGISVSGSPITSSGTITVTNSAPDQVVSLTGAGTTTTSGTYPNFTITSNDQFVGTVTSVGLTSATSGVTIGSSPITTSGNISLTIATASGSQNGLLSSTDWTTFNNKQNTITNPVTGTGTTNYVARWTSGSAIGVGVLYDNGTNVGIGTASPSTLLHIEGSGLNAWSRFTNTTNTSGLYIGTSADGEAIIYQAGNYYMGFYTNSAERMRITSGGNVLVGTTTDSGEKLQVTGTSYFSDSVGIGISPNTNYGIRLARTITSNVDSNGISSEGQVQSDVTSSANIFNSVSNTQNASFTITGIRHYRAVQGTFGASSVVTNQFGFLAESNLTGATNNYGFYGNIASGTNRWNLYMNGTANNYMAGSLGIGSTSLTGYSFRNSKTITGAVFSYGNYSNGQVQSDVTSAAAYYETNANTQAATFTLTSLLHYQAVQGTFGLNSTVTNQYGFVAHATLTGATNNYGFFGNIASGSNRWNLYMGGSASNYLEGDTAIGTTSLGTATKLTLGGSETAVSAIARGGLINTTLTASANNDVLVGLDINPTFTIGAFTGITSNAIRISNGNINYNQGSAELRLAGNLWLSSNSTETRSYLYGNTGQFRWILNNNTEIARLFSTGNLLLQNGGTFTDAGFRLDVNGTARISDSTYLATSSGNVGIGITTATSKLSVFSNSATIPRVGRFVQNNSGTSNIGALQAVNAASTGSAIDAGHWSTSSTDWIIRGYNNVSRAENDNVNSTGSTLVFGVRADGNVGIGNTPTASLDVKASTTSASSLRIRSGTAPTSPNDGDIWFDGTDIKMRIGGVTKTFTLT
jgi:hypothetical protein